MNKLQKIIKIIHNWRRTNKIEKLYLNKKWLDCISECNKAINSEEVDFFVYYYLGLSQFQINFIDESTENLNQALIIIESYRLKSALKIYRCYAKYHIAVNFRKQRDYSRAIEQLDKNIEDEPGYINNYYLKAFIYEDLGKTELALEVILIGLTINPKDKGLLEFQKNLTYNYSLEQSEKRNGG